MSYVIDASGERGRNVPPTSVEDYTQCYWTLIATPERTGTFRFPLGLEDAVSGGSAWSLAGWDTGDAWGVSSSSPSTPTLAPTNPDAGVWRFKFVRGSEGLLEAKWWDPDANEGAGGWVASTVQVSGAGIFTPVVSNVGNDGFNEYVPGLYAHARLWNDQRSDAQMEAEMASPTAVVATGLLYDCPLLNNGDDISGNDNDMVFEGTPTFDADMPLAGSVTLVVADLNHAHTLDEPALTQAHVLDPGDAQHAHTLEAPALVQAHTLAVDGLAHGHLLDSPELSIATVVEVADLLHAHPLETVTLLQNYSLSIEDGQHAHTLDGVTLQTGVSLAVQRMAHAHGLDGDLNLSQAHILTPHALAHGHALDVVTLTQEPVLSVAGLLHGHALDDPALTQAHTLAVQSLLHAHQLDAVILSLASLLEVGDLTHGQLLDAVTLTQSHLLTPGGLLHTHALDGLTLTQSQILAVQELLHAHPLGVTDLTLFTAHIVRITNVEIHVPRLGNVEILLD